MDNLNRIPLLRCIINLLGIDIVVNVKVKK